MEHHLIRLCLQCDIASDSSGALFCTLPLSIPAQRNFRRSQLAFDPFAKYAVCGPQTHAEQTLRNRTTKRTNNHITRNWSDQPTRNDTPTGSASLPNQTASYRYRSDMECGASWMVILNGSVMLNFVSCLMCRSCAQIAGHAINVRLQDILIDKCRNFEMTHTSKCFFSDQHRYKFSAFLRVSCYYIEYVLDSGANFISFDIIKSLGNSRTDNFLALPLVVDLW